MIGKKVARPKLRSSSKAQRVMGLLGYVRAPQQSRTDEKCIYENARGFITESAEAQQAEMVALSEGAVRSRDPVNHYLLSWREGDRPTEAQVEQAVDLVLDELGLVDHQVVYGLHDDTDNVHLHLVINRVHPDTEQVIKAAGGWDVEGIHRAVARIVHAQGWEPQEAARYRVTEAGEVVRRDHDEDRPREPQQRALDRENRTGEQSAQRQAIEKAGPVIEGASSWAQLHEDLAELGMRYERKGSGAVLFVGDTAVKASRVSRKASFGTLQKHLGAYEPPGAAVAKVPAAAQGPRAVQQSPGLAEYHRERARRQAVRTHALGALKQRHQQQRQQLAKHQAERRQRVLSGNWRDKGDLLNALRQQLAQEQRQERRRLSERQAQERQGLQDKLPQVVSVVAWLRAVGKTVEAEQWRYRHAALSAQQRPTQQRPADRPTDPRYARYQQHRGEQEAARARALAGLTLKQGRQVARLKAMSRMRWKAARMMAGRSRLAWWVWKRTVRQTEARAWERLRQAQRAEVRRIRAQYQPTSWQDWQRDQERADGRHDRGRDQSDSGSRRAGAARGGAVGGGAKRRGAEPHPRILRALAAARADAGVRHVSELDVAGVTPRGDSLLPGDARGDLGQRQAGADPRLRRAPERVRGRR